MIAEQMVSLIGDVIGNEPLGRTCRCFTRDEKLIELGVSPYTLLTYTYFFAHDGEQYELSSIDTEVTAAKTRSNPRDNCPAMVQIEEWNIRTQTSEAIANIAAACFAWKVRRPERSLGIYRIMPRFNYWTPVLIKRAIDDGNARHQYEMTSALERDMRLNEQVEAELGRYVDYLTPHCYVQNQDEQSLEEWKWSAAYGVLEAARLARPPQGVMPIAWYHAQATGLPLEEEVWRESLEFLSRLPSVSAVALHTSGEEPSYDWRSVVLDVFPPCGVLA